jgi:hypothetical protein
MISKVFKSFSRVLYHNKFVGTIQRSGRRGRGEGRGRGWIGWFDLLDVYVLVIHWCWGGGRERERERKTFRDNLLFICNNDQQIGEKIQKKSL